MRKLCPNLDHEDGLDTVLEVPIPEEMFAGGGGRGKSRGGSKYSSVAGCTNIKSWMKHGGGGADRYDASEPSQISRAAQLQLLLGVIGAPLVPLPLQPLHRPILSRDVKNDPLEASTARYIVQQYIAAVGGEEAINSIDSMYAMGKVRMATVELVESENGGGGKGGGAAAASKKGGKNGGGGGEMGGFVLWQKKPDFWCLELVVSGCKLSAGSDGRVAWRQTPWHHSHASRGPPRPLRRSIQV